MTAYERVEEIARRTTFENMDFELFVAGETRILANMKDPMEKQGRLQVLCKLAHWLCKHRNWNTVRGLFEVILESIEMGESEWTDNFDHFETMIPVGEVKKENEDNRCQRQKTGDILV